MKRGRILGIDHGTRRIGLAVSDESRLIARELTIITRKSKVEDFARIRNIIFQERITALVIGIPTNYEGASTQADQVRRWVDHLAETISDCPIALWDEQLSSVDAHELARDRRRKPSAPVDDLAARVILQSYLDALRAGLAAPPEGPADS